MTLTWGNRLNYYDETEQKLFLQCTVTTSSHLLGYNITLTWGNRLNYYDETEQKLFLQCTVSTSSHLLGYSITLPGNIVVWITLSDVYFKKWQILTLSSLYILLCFIIRVFCPRAGLSLRTEEPMLKFCPKEDLPLQTQEPRLQFY